MTYPVSAYKQATVDRLKEQGYNHAFKPEIAFGCAVRVVRLWDGLSLPKLMRGEVRVKDMEG